MVPALAVSRIHVTFNRLKLYHIFFSVFLYCFSHLLAAFFPFHYFNAVAHACQFHQNHLALLWLWFSTENLITSTEVHICERFWAWGPRLPTSLALPIPFSFALFIIHPFMPLLLAYWILGCIMWSSCSQNIFGVFEWHCIGKHEKLIGRTEKEWNLMMRTEMYNGPTTLILAERAETC